MFQSVILLLSLAVIASAGYTSNIIQRFVSTLEPKNKQFEQRINEVVNDYENMDKNNVKGNQKLIKKLEDIESIDFDIQTMIKEINANLSAFNSDIQQDVKRVIYLLGEIEQRNKSVKQVAVKLLNDIKNTSGELSQDIIDNFNILKKTEFFSFYQINDVVARMAAKM